MDKTLNIEFVDFKKRIENLFPHLNLKVYKNKFTGMDNPTDIVCGTHGVFKVTPKNFLESNGCEKCFKLTNVENKDSIVFSETYCYLHKREECEVCEGVIKDQEDANYLKQLVPKNRYKFIYHPNCIIVKCKYHGSKDKSLQQLFDYDICYKCNEHLKKRKQIFMKKVVSQYKLKYDYSEVVYQNEHTPVIIKRLDNVFKIAPKHISNLG